MDQNLISYTSYCAIDLANNNSTVDDNFAVVIQSDELRSWLHDGQGWMLGCRFDENAFF